MAEKHEKKSEKDIPKKGQEQHPGRQFNPEHHETHKKETSAPGEQKNPARVNPQHKEQQKKW